MKTVKSQIYFLIFFAISSNVYGLYRKGKCPENKSLNNIDIERVSQHKKRKKKRVKKTFFLQFFSREWYEKQITPFNFGDGKKCGVINLSALENNFRYTYTQER